MPIDSPPPSGPPEQPPPSSERLPAAIDPAALTGRRRRPTSPAAPSDEGAKIVTREEAADSRAQQIRHGTSFARPAEEFSSWEEILPAVTDAFVERSQTIPGGTEALKKHDPYIHLVTEVAIDAHPEWGVEPIHLQRLVELLRAYQFGYGALEDHMRLDGLEELYFNAPDEGYYIQRGKKHRVPDQIFRDRREMVNFLRRVAAENGLEINLNQPNLDAELRDGSRLNATLEPIAYGSPDFVIRKHRLIPFPIEELVKRETITAELAHEMGQWVAGGLNIVVSGGTSSGKTSLLNALGRAFIPSDERVLVLENRKELQIKTEDTKYFQTRESATRENEKDDVSMKDLIRFCLRKAPDRIFVGEVRGPEAYHALLAWNSGHDGSMTTLHANSAREALGKIEMLAGMAGELGEQTVRRLIADSIDIVIQVEKVRRSEQRHVREVIQVLSPHKADDLDPGVAERVKALTEAGQIRQITDYLGYLTLYRFDGTSLVKLNDLLPIAGRG